jgi:hypothetical protein
MAGDTQRRFGNMSTSLVNGGSAHIHEPAELIAA